MEQLQKNCQVEQKLTKLEDVCVLARLLCLLILSSTNYVVSVFTVCISVQRSQPLSALHGKIDSSINHQPRCHLTITLTAAAAAAVMLSLIHGGTKKLDV